MDGKNPEQRANITATAKAPGRATQASTTETADEPPAGAGPVNRPLVKEIESPSREPELTEREWAETMSSRNAPAEGYWSTRVETLTGREKDNALDFLDWLGVTVGQPKRPVKEETEDGETYAQESVKKDEEESKVKDEGEGEEHGDVQVKAEPKDA